MNEKNSLSTELLAVGTVIANRYEVKQLVGCGGMAAVYLVADRLHNGQELAIKVLHKQFADDKIYVKRFVREVQLMSKVDDRNIVKTYDIGVDDGLIYFTMEYVPAQSLESLIDNYSLTSTQIARLAIEICRGLQAVHRKGIIHRDLKPANILVLNNGTVKITDFGVAREKYSRLTTKTQKVGSICYMAPEIWLGKKLTPSIDFYSLGVVLYELATGDVPFDHDWIGELMRMHLEDKPEPPVKKNPKVPGWLNQLILRLLEKSPRERFKTAEEIMVYVKLYALDPDLLASMDEQAKSELLVSDRNSLDWSAAPLKAEQLSKIQRVEQTRRKTYVLELTGTRLIDEAGLQMRDKKKRRKATVVIPLPRRAAVVIEIEPPSRDFIFLGVFLASLQVFDAIFTSMGLNHFGTNAEGNPFLRLLMEQLGPQKALLMVKFVAILIVIMLTVLAKKMKWVKDLISLLSCIYLFAAILPWMYLLYIKYGYL